MSILYHYLKSTLYLFIFSWSLLNALFLFQYFITFSCHVSISFLGCGSFTHFICFWWSSQFSWVLVRHIVGYPSDEIHWMFSSILWWHYGFGGGSPEKWSAIFNTLYQGFKKKPLSHPGAPILIIFSMNDWTVCIGDPCQSPTKN